jgi:uncharacterized protein
MTPQEQQMLQGLIQRVNQTQLPEKDSDAEEMLNQTLGRNPDALYILSQTVLVQQYALDQAQKQIADLKQQAQQQAQQPKHSTSFLGNLLGQHDEPTRPAPPPPPPPQYAQQPQYAPVPGYAPTPSYAPTPGYAPAYGAPQSGGFLRSAAQTAAGVAAGALAFEGIESLMHGFGGAAGYGPGIGGFGGDRPEIINNYYEGGDSGGSHEHLSPDIEDRRDASSTFSDAVDNNDHGDSLMQSDDNSNDFTDDSSNFDDSSDFGDGGFDSGGGDDNNF